jgi:hypothetical protein
MWQMSLAEANHSMLLMSRGVLQAVAAPTRTQPEGPSNAQVTDRSWHRVRDHRYAAAFGPGRS